MADAAHHMQMRQIVAGLSEGVILIEPDQTIAYANDAAVMMHGVTDVGDLGATVSEYRANFTLHYRNHREIGPLQHPLDRVLAGEVFRDVVVELIPTRDPNHRWMHRIRSLVTTEADGTPNGLALVMQDVSETLPGRGPVRADVQRQPGSGDHLPDRGSAISSGSTTASST